MSHDVLLGIKSDYMCAHLGKIRVPYPYQAFFGGSSMI